jgi:hypothetical protein
VAFAFNILTVVISAYFVSVKHVLPVVNVV